MDVYSPPLLVQVDLNVRIHIKTADGFQWNGSTDEGGRPGNERDSKSIRDNSEGGLWVDGDGLDALR